MNIEKSLETPSNVEVQFEIHGCICGSCQSSIQAYIGHMQKDQLETFVAEHGQHKGLKYICSITEPPHLASELLFEVEFSVAEKTGDTNPTP